MWRNRVIMALSVLMLSSVVAMAQWTGEVNADGGWNFGHGDAENAAMKVKYSGRKSHFGARLGGGHNYQPSSQTTMILDAKKEGDEYYKYESKTMAPRNWNAGGRLDFGYLFNPLNTLDVSVGYVHKGKNDFPDMYSERYNGPLKDLLSGNQKDSILFRKHTIEDKINYKRKFEDRPDAVLCITASNVSDISADVNERITSGNFYSKNKRYATYSSLNDFNSSLKASYDDIFRFDRSTLKMTAGLDVVTNQDIDGYSAETYVNGQWRDSTDYRQSYFYYSVSTEPYVNLSYSIGKFDLFIKERVQWYQHALADKLEQIRRPEDLVGLFDKHDWKNLLAAGVKYNFNDMHCLSLDYARSIARPDYKKLCTTLTIGNSEGEYFIGNPDLRPEITDKVNIRYTYSKSIFITTFDLNYRYKSDTAEKVIDVDKMKDIKDPGVKTLYTWINNKRQETWGTRLNLKMNGKDVKAEIWASLNYDIYGNNEKANKEDFNYELGTIVSVFLNETTSLSSKLAYISAKQSAYNLKGEDVIADLRFTKTILKGFDLYLELRDIVDKDLYEETWNAEQTYLKMSTTRTIQRCILLGLNYKF